MKFAETEIKKMMKNLDISREEAIQLLQDDEDDVSVELTAEQQKVVKTKLYRVLIVFFSFENAVAVACLNYVHKFILTVVSRKNVNYCHIF